MPDMDLPPGAYRERKPKGWRWKLPWASPDGARLPFAMFLLMTAFVIYFVTQRSPATPFGEMAGIAVFAFVAGGMFAMWTRD